MKWLLQILLGIALAAACGVILLDWQMIWHVERIAANPVRVEELKLLALLMFGLAGLSSLLLFLLPSITAVTLNRRADRVVEMAQAELRADFPAPGAAPRSTPSSRGFPRQRRAVRLAPSRLPDRLDGSK